MSIWCRNCGKTTFNETTCDHCNKNPKNEKEKYIKTRTRITQGKPKINSIKDDLSDNEKKENVNKISKKEKGDKYEAYIAEHYKKIGYLVIENGKEKGLKDGGIDLIAEKDNEVILIQCKDWNEKNSHQINHKDIKVLRSDASDFLVENTKYKNYKIKLRYTLSGNFIHISAKKYMEECKDDIDYEIIKPAYQEKENFNSYSHKRKSNKQSFNKSYMKECEVCGNKIAVKATSCPHCGDTKSKNLFWKIIKIVAIIVAILFTLQVIVASIGIAIVGNIWNNTNEQTHKQEKEIIKLATKTKPPIINFKNNDLENTEIEKKIKNEPKEITITNFKRNFTNNQTKKEKCNKEWWDYIKKSNNTIAKIESENRKIKLLLQKKRINYHVIIKQKVRNIKIDENEIIKKSCSEKYFTQLIQREKRIKTVKKENEVLKEIMRINKIKNEEDVYYIEVKREKNKPKLNMIITENTNLKKNKEP